MNELEQIDQQIRTLKCKAAKLRENLKPVYLELNDIPLMKFRGNRLKFSTVKKENKIVESKTQIKMSKIKITVDSKQYDPKTLIVAAGFSGVEISAPDVVSPKKTAYTLSFSRGEELLEMGGYLATLSKEDVTKELERRDAAKKKADEAKKK